VAVKLYTIGYTQKPLRRAIHLLRDAEVDAVIDVRLRNSSQLAGWAKRDDLAFILETFGIGYQHQTNVAPSDELLDTYRRDHDWDRYVEGYHALLEARGVLDEFEAVLGQYQRPCLLCSEAKADRCHRRLLAELLGARLPDLSVVHLV
jgi:uncharacterized protein (DUF488 family)